jgi:signal peptidase I
MTTERPVGGVPCGEPRSSLPAHVLAALQTEPVRESQALAATPRRSWAGRDGACAIAAIAWTGAFIFLLGDARLPAMTCGLTALALSAGILASGWLGRTLVAVTVNGESMLPTYRDGDRVLVRRNLPPRAGQVVVIERPTAGVRWNAPPVERTAGGAAIADREWLIKRVAAVQGDPVPRDRVPALADVDDGVVPPGSLVVLGDNPENSLDSRLVGFFPADRLLGTVQRRLTR